MNIAGEGWHTCGMTRCGITDYRLDTAAGEYCQSPGYIYTTPSYILCPSFFFLFIPLFFSQLPLVQTNRSIKALTTCTRFSGRGKTISFRVIVFCHKIISSEDFSIYIVCTHSFVIILACSQRRQRVIERTAPSLMNIFLLFVRSL